jgi:hypothetical protein
LVADILGFDVFGVGIISLFVSYPPAHHPLKSWYDL